MLEINGTPIIVHPATFQVTVLDIDDGDATTRTADGVLTRSRITTKRQIEMSWGLLSWASISSILQAMADEFFDLRYPDPMTGTYLTRTFYVGNRPAPFSVAKGSEIYWSGLKLTLTEQ